MTTDWHGAPVTPLSGGYSGETFLVGSDPADQVVLRIYRRAPERAVVDAGLLRLLRGVLPVASVLEVRPASADEPAVLVTSRLDGTPLDQAAARPPRHARPDRARRLVGGDPGPAVRGAVRRLRHVRRRGSGCVHARGPLRPGRVRPLPAGQRPDRLLARRRLRRVDEARRPGGRRQRRRGGRVARPLGAGAQRLQRQEPARRPRDARRSAGCSTGSSRTPARRTPTWAT